MKTVLINVPFRDVYTGEMYTAGKTYPMSEERVKEVKEVNPNFVTVVGNATVEEVPTDEEPVEEVPTEEVPARRNRRNK